VTGWTRLLLNLCHGRTVGLDLAAIGSRITGSSVADDGRREDNGVINGFDGSVLSNETRGVGR